jgi:multidrug efflux system membrane fusion protein
MAPPHPSTGPDVLSNLVYGTTIEPLRRADEALRQQAADVLPEFRRRSAGKRRGRRSETPLRSSSRALAPAVVLGVEDRRRRRLCRPRRDRAQGRVLREIHAIGRVEPVASVVLKPQVAGLVVEVRVEDGADVRAGDPIVALDLRPLEAVVHAAEAELARDAAFAEDKKRASAQIDLALQKNSMSERAAQEAQAEAAAADALVRRDQAALDTAKLALEYGTVRAPFDGRLGKLLVRRGSAVKINETEVVSIVQVAPIRVGFSVPEDRLPEIRKAASDALPLVRVTADGVQQPIEGVLSFIDNTVSAASGSIELMATFENKDRRLWPGEFVQVSLQTGVDRDATFVPTRAIQTGQKGTYVFVVGADQKVEMRPVEVSRAAGDASVVSDGIHEGEVVVVDGQLRLVPGTRVEAKDAESPSAEKPAK